jgi:hypothetical protein
MSGEWPRPHITQYTPTTVTLYLSYSKLRAPHIQPVVADRQHEQLNELTYTVLEKWMKLGFHVHNS